MRRLLLSILMLAASLQSQAVKKDLLAIVVDSVSHSRCSAEIGAYASSCEAEGYRTIVLARAWGSPDEIRHALEGLFRDEGLCGVVLVGDIPVPMIRKAQFLTSAFKMDEDGPLPLRETSVPSDRFYDDFSMRFEYAGRDSLQRNLFYYNLSPEGTHCRGTFSTTTSRRKEARR